MDREVTFLPEDVNPYAPPSASPRAERGEPTAPDLRLFVRWEKLRLLYNAILAVETIFALAAIRPRVEGGIPVVAFMLAMLCFMANVCFCAGPVLDGYAHLVGLRSVVVSWVIFGLGTAFSMLLVPVAVLSLGGMID